jgi:uroporphyrinogen-III synthase
VTALRLLLTRPEPDALRTAAALRDRGHQVLLAPLLHFAPVTDADLGAGPWAGLLMSSANAARAMARHPRLRDLRPLPVLAVGDRSAEAARAAGFANVASAMGDAGDLTRIVAGQFGGAGARLLYLAGEDRAADLEAALGAHDIAVDTVVVYRMAAAEALPAETAAALSERWIDGVLHYSRRSAEIYLRCAAAAGLDAAATVPAQYCLSAEVAAPLLAAGAVIVRIAPQPNEKSLLALVGNA